MTDMESWQSAKIPFDSRQGLSLARVPSCPGVFIFRRVYGGFKRKI
jgi:hypothetical protein